MVKAARARKEKRRIAEKQETDELIKCFNLGVKMGMLNPKTEVELYAEFLRKQRSASEQIAEPDTKGAPRS